MLNRATGQESDIEQSAAGVSPHQELTHLLLSVTMSLSYAAPPITDSNMVLKASYK
jgi:hypothetical protein